MQVCLWVFIVITFVGSHRDSFGIELIAQNSELVPASINEESGTSEQDSYVCPEDEINRTNSLESGVNADSRQKTSVCSPDFKVESDTLTSSNSSSRADTTFNENDEQISLLPNPEVEFIDDYMVKFDGGKSRDTIFYGGVVPFVALPDSSLATEDSFFNEESFSIFLYFKRKF